MTRLVDQPDIVSDDRQPSASADFIVEVGNAQFVFERFRFADPVVTAAQIAERVGAHPMTQFKILQQLPNGEIETKRPTETTDLREPGRERFFVIESDRTFGFTVNGLAMEWPLARPNGEQLRLLARAREDQELVQVTPQGFMPVEDEQPVPLDGPAAEEFRLVPRARTVTVYYREVPFELERRAWTTEELMTRFGVPAGYKLDLIQPDGEFRELKPGHSFKLREGMEFTSHAPTGQSS